MVHNLVVLVKEVWLWKGKGGEGKVCEAVERTCVLWQEKGCGVRQDIFLWKRRRGAVVVSSPGITSQGEVVRILKFVKCREENLVVKPKPQYQHSNLVISMRKITCRK